MRTHGPNGDFIRTRFPWDGSNWNDGYVGAKGKFLVYCPQFPGAHISGYALRSHVVWWLTYNEVCPPEMVIHHKDNVPDNDKLDNLEMMSRADHTVFHCKRLGERFVCEYCHNEFHVPKYRVKARIKVGHRTRFCSRKCCYAYRHLYGHSQEQKERISEGLKRAYAERVRQCVFA